MFDDETAIKNLIAPLEPYLEDMTLKEIRATATGELWLEPIQGDKRHVEIPTLDRSFWVSLAHVFTNIKDADRHPARPRASAMLPGGHRLELLLGGQVRTGLSVTIRLYRPLDLQLEDYQQITKDGLQPLAFDLVGTLRHMMKTGANIIVAGGTGSGKTALLNTLIKDIPMDARLVTIEDTFEIVAPQTEVQSLQVDRHAVDPSREWAQIVDHAMRSTPDRLIMSELSVSNTEPTIRLMGTGHRGLLTTVHADDIPSVLNETFYYNLSLAGKTPNPHVLPKQLARLLDAVVHITKHDGRPGIVTDVQFPSITTQEADEAD